MTTEEFCKELKKEKRLTLNLKNELHDKMQPQVSNILNKSLFLMNVIRAGIQVSDLEYYYSKFPEIAVFYLQNTPRENVISIKMLEKSISRDSKLSYFYSYKILKGRFPLGEPSITLEDECKTKYLNFLKSLSDEKQ